MIICTNYFKFCTVVTRFPVPDAVLSSWCPEAAAGVLSVDSSGSDGNGDGLSGIESDTNSLGIPEMEMVKWYPLRRRKVHGVVVDAEPSNGSEAEVAGVVIDNEKAEVISVSSSMNYILHKLKLVLMYL